MLLRALLVLGLLLPLSSFAAADPRCTGGIPRAAKRFDSKAMPDASPRERYLAFVKACAEGEVVALTKTLVAIPTVSAQEPKKKAPHFRKLRETLRRWAARQGMSFRAIGTDDVFELRWGEGEPKLGLVFHGDVVPAPRHEWSRDPFVPVVVNGRLYGRGVEDDKGPLAATLVDLAMARAVGLRPEGPILVIVGNGEESDWTPMRAYAETAPKMEHVISVDANFPVVAAQSGFVAWGLEAKLAEATGEGTLDAVDANGGEFLTQVPGQATLTLAPHGIGVDAAEQLVRAAIAKLSPVRPKLKAELGRDGERLVLTTHGVAVHSSVADEGHNALWDLAAVANALPLRRNGLSALLRVVATKFDDDNFGRKLGLYYEDALMGPLLVAPTMFRMEKGKAVLRVNMRRPQGETRDDFERALGEAAAAIEQETSGVVVEDKAFRRFGEPHVADVSGPLVTRLLATWQKYRGGQDLKPISVRGGTYARLFPRAVDFGPAFPGETYSGHAPDESISVEHLGLTAQLIADAVSQFALEP